MPTLSKTSALVTGATKGIGLAIAKMLAAEGINLILNARSEANLERVCAELQAQFPQIQIISAPGNVGCLETVQSIVDLGLKHFGRLDIVINNAGISSPFKLLQEMDEQTIDDTIAINLKGPLYVMKSVIPGMVNQGGGWIININSMAGKVAYPFSSVYCASKFGLKALTQCVAEEQRINGIKIVGIYPGEVNTPMWQDIEPEVIQNPDRMLDPEDVAEAVRYILNQPAKALIQDITLIPQVSPPH